MRKILLGFLSLMFLISPLMASAATKPVTPLGNDISYPQCNTVLPTGQAFGIVGVNGGLATTTNPCLAQQLAWAAKSTGATTQAKVQLYVNTANPGGLNTTSWPTTGKNRYGTCDHSNSLACAYQYGWSRALDDAKVRGVANPDRYIWWLDVETTNTWDSTKGGQARNAADLEGMTEYFQSIGAKVGIYSSSYQWNQIVGSSVSRTSSLNYLGSWLAGASDLTGAKANCLAAPLTHGGVVRLTQYTLGGLDYDYSCR